VFTKNRDRPLEGSIAEAFFQQVLGLADQRQLLSHEHFTVDGTLLEAWASHKSFRPLDELPAPSDDEHGAAFLGYQASLLTENRHGLIVQADVRAPEVLRGDSKDLDDVNTLRMHAAWEGLVSPTLHGFPLS
jgi:hypothetical protein